MAVKGVSSIITGSFVNRFVGSAQGTATRVNSSSGDSSITSLAKGLRFGAQTYSTAISSLNATISFLNLGVSTLKRLDKIVDKMLTLSERAKEQGTGASGRASLDHRFKRLVKEFRELTSSAKMGDFDAMTREGIEGILTNVGLSADASTSVAAAFAEFDLVKTDETLASEYTKGKRPVQYPAPSSGVETPEDHPKIFDTSISRRSNAYQMTSDLKALRKQIENNIEALESAGTMIGRNMELARQTGLAMLEIADGIKKGDDADKVAQLLRSEITKRAPGYLSQLENLNNIAAAAISLLSGESSVLQR